MAPLGKRSPLLQRLREPDPRVAAGKVIEPAELPIAVPRVELRRLKRESIKIGAVAALLARGFLGASQQS